MNALILSNAPDGKQRSPREVSIRIDGWRINVATQRWLVERVVSDASVGRGGTVFTINLDHLSKLPHDPQFRAAYERASYVSADGMPVVAIARAEGVALDRVTGADLVVPLSRAASDAKIPIYFFGSSEDVLERTIAHLRSLIPNLVVAGFEAPPMGFDPTGDAARAAAERIAASGAAICFIALGAPKQEIFANAAFGWTEGVIYLGVGAAVDFLAGTRRRAPRLLQHLGLEWAWRVAQEPHRLTARYVRSGLWLLSYVVRALAGWPRASIEVEREIYCAPKPPQTIREKAIEPTIRTMVG